MNRSNATLTALCALALFAIACNREQAPAPVAEKTAAATAEQATSPKTTAPPAAEAPKIAKKTPSDRKAAAAIEWPAGIEWVDDWTDARARSAETGRPICLVVYADWCPRCKELIPVFADAEVVEASRDLIMIKQDNDLKPDWLMAYADQGSYVPRIFFFGLDGNLRTDLTSGHPRFPYFYTPTGKTSLLRSMRAAVKS